ncbi:MAG: SDR family NAD(P)-dependent oxidoreductase [Steroidobacteraceae bacterium]
MRRLEGKSIVITGAASGIGRAATILFASEGANLTIVDRMAEIESTAEAVRAAGGRAISLVRDASRDHDVADFIDAAVSEFGRLDVCYANAGVSGGFPVFDELTEADWMEVLGVNLIGPFLAIKHAARAMVPQRRGSIICTTSVAGLRGGGGGAPYSASKAAVISLVQTGASQFAGTGVRLNAICPGLTDGTGMGRPILDWARKSGLEEEIVQVIPLRRCAQAEEVARAAAFLASDESSYVNGHVLVVDGGLASSLPTVPPHMMSPNRA